MLLLSFVLLMSAPRFPHPLVLLIGFILLAAALSYVLPAGVFARHPDPTTRRKVVVPGSYHHAAAAPVGPVAALVAIPRGLAAAADVIFFVFLTGGAFTVVDQTGALRHGVDWLVLRLRGREGLGLPILALLFATMGALENMQEEIIPLVPVLLVLMRRLGYPALKAAAVGAAVSPINPFQVGIAQQLAQLPLLSGAGFRLVFLALALAVWIGGTMRFARRYRTAPLVDVAAEDAALARAPTAGRHGLVLGLLLLMFVGFTYGVLRLGWEFEQMGALFFVLGWSAGWASSASPGRSRCWPTSTAPASATSSRPPTAP